MLNGLLCACGPGIASRLMRHHRGGFELPALLLSFLVGAGIGLAISTPRGRGIISSMNTTLGANQLPRSRPMKEVDDEARPRDEGKTSS